jgi:hypothetical protein
MPIATSDRTARIGGTRRMLTIVVVINVLATLVAAVSSLQAENQDADHAHRQAALNWGIEQQRQVFDEILPRGARRDVVLPICRVVTLRSGSLSDDRREFRIRIEQLCDGSIRHANVGVARAPFAVQIAQMRFRDEHLTLADAIPHLQVDHRDLKPADALQILRSLDGVRLSPNPTNALILDGVSVEIDVISWGEIRIVTYLEDKRSGWRQLGSTVREAMRLAKISNEQLLYDPQDVEQ